MGIDIDVECLCPKCRLDHEAEEQLNGRKIPVVVSSLCKDCKNKFGLGREKGEPVKHKRKYTRRLDKDTKRFIKNLLKSGKKAEKLEAKAEKLTARADELREKAASMKAGMEAVKNAVQDCE
jgi:hypothetical protein